MTAREDLAGDAVATALPELKVALVDGHAGPKEGMLTFAFYFELCISQCLARAVAPKPWIELREQLTRSSVVDLPF